MTENTIPSDMIARITKSFLTWNIHEARHVMYKGVEGILVLDEGPLLYEILFYSRGKQESQSLSVGTNFETMLAKYNSLLESDDFATVSKVTSTQSLDADCRKVLDISRWINSRNTSVSSSEKSSTSNVSQ